MHNDPHLKTLTRCLNFLSSFWIPTSAVCVVTVILLESFYPTTLGRSFVRDILIVFCVFGSALLIRLISRSGSSRHSSSSSPASWAASRSLSSRPPRSAPRHRK